MKATSQSFALGCALAALASAPVPAGAEDRPPSSTYVVTMISSSAAGNVVSHESLSLQRGASGARLRLASTDGSVVSTPLRLTDDGMIASNSQDGAITCYNMAMDALASARQPADATSSVFVRFGQSVVHVPIRVSATQTQGSVRTTVLHGASQGTYTAATGQLDAGILIQASIEDDGGDLRGAMFDEVQYLQTPQHVVARSTCLLQRALVPPVLTPA